MCVRNKQITNTNYDYTIKKKCIKTCLSYQRENNNPKLIVYKSNKIYYSHWKDNTG